MKKPVIFLAASVTLLASLLAEEKWAPAKAPLMTKWANDVTPDKALSEYPRPQMVRKDWLNLNGLWDYSLTDSSATAPSDFSAKILVPFCYESALSGVGKPSIPNERLWYRRTFTLPASWKDEHVILHFGAVNYESAITLNGKSIGIHRGGYTAFDFDITDALQPGTNELTVSTWNPLRADQDNAQVLGKQRVKPGGIFYTGATGIWQTVWLEPVPVAHITELKITPDLDANSLHLRVRASAVSKVAVTALDKGKVIATATAAADADITLPIPTPHPWTPDDPHLYDLQVSLVQDDKPVDTVQSYFAMRKIALGKDEQGRNRMFLNNKFLFEVGPLDQGYWPDGIYTAPTDEALRYDIEITKKLGFNMTRKHAKVEPDRWYYWTDKLGLLVWQDMPQMFGGKDGALSDEAKKQFEKEWKAEIEQFYNHPSIIVWTTFNEGWGQYDTPKIVALTKELDPTRLVNNASGWTDKNAGDIHDTHHYPEPWCELPEPDRASVDGEFGGITMSVDAHRWNNDVFGYGSVLQSNWLVTRRYQELFKTVYKLRDDRGMSAAVYTQITDVEQEINGLLTYDREVMKADLPIVSAANQGKFLPLPPNPNPAIVPTATEEPQTWSYTTDKPADDWMKPTFNSADWKTGKSGFGHDAGPVHTLWNTNDIWLRRNVTLPANLPAQLAFECFHDEDVEIYVNGVLAASAKGYISSYQQLPMNAEDRAALKPGNNVLAVHCKQTRGGQFIDVGIVKAK